MPGRSWSARRAARCSTGTTTPTPRACWPRCRRRAAAEAAHPDPGRPALADRAAAGCPFAPRCRYAFERCWGATPPLDTVHDDPLHQSACWLPDDAQGRRASQARRRRWLRRPLREAAR